MRTPFDLQDALCADITKLFQGFPLRGAAGALTKLNVYAQDLPETETDDETDTDPAPYCIVKLVDGTAGGNRNSVRVVLVFLRARYRARQARTPGHPDLDAPRV